MNIARMSTARTRPIPAGLKAPLARGLSLVELLVAMVISLVALAAVVQTMTSTSWTGDQNTLQSQFNQEAAIATSLIATHFQNAGYSPRVNFQQPFRNRNYEGPPVQGCDNGFQNPTQAINAGALACNPAGNGPDAVAVMYEATNDNSNFTGAGPADCHGQAILIPTPSAINPSITYALAENRYYVNNGRLMCAGSGQFSNPQPLINNVVDFQITYGVAPDVLPNAPRPRSEIPNRFLSARDMLPNNWGGVVSMRICLLLRSENNATSQAMPSYTDCNNQAVSPAANDRRLYRAVWTTLTFRNRAPACADSSATTASFRCGSFNNTELL